MRSGIAQVQGTQDVHINEEAKRVNFKFAAKKTGIQELLNAVKAKGYEASLLLQARGVSAELSEKARAAILKLKGVKSVGRPDKNGIIALDFNLEQRTLLDEVLNAAKEAGVALADPKDAK